MGGEGSRSRSRSLLGTGAGREGGGICCEVGGWVVGGGGVVPEWKVETGVFSGMVFMGLSSGVGVEMGGTGLLA